ncbi:uncharacterized protein PITG_19748 [Phytophthora infestans T30-4]|uniref:DUF659 domain-containing protein n=1 Tax=Phytophthora infestans (strain T30-4) TaxID=403677 RepID=D0P158_PHYIT|nr:uncharacterized protein PITG_19748 [Phytophthora infestans T30-4]EEY54079.1 conserved hypothetical protein [Phytophthora infestans T30-4]|eukprot:XP_002895963.1 conserved hypothetical protein [Phytophthora infestans T30-4]
MAFEISRMSEVEAKAGRLVELRHPNVVFNGCSAHTMNLLLKDMFKSEFFANVLKKAVKLVTFVRARHLLLDRVRAKRRALPKRAKIGELSAPLMLHYADAAAAQKRNDVVDILQDKQFWASAKIAVRLTKPVTRALANFETDTCSNSMILHEFERLKHTDVYTASIPGLTDPSFITPPSNSTRIAYLLDPSKDTSVFIGDSMRDTVAGALAFAWSYWTLLA